LGKLGKSNDFNCCSLITIINAQIIALELHANDIHAIKEPSNPYNFVLQHYIVSHFITSWISRHQNLSVELGGASLLCRSFVYVCLLGREIVGVMVMVMLGWCLGWVFDIVVVYLKWNGERSQVRVTRWWL
jgi:hypothetical protein